MQADEIRFLYAYDRWATKRILDQLDGLDTAVWESQRGGRPQPWCRARPSAGRCTALAAQLSGVGRVTPPA